MRTRICAVVLMLAAVLDAQQRGVLAGVVVDQRLRPVAGAIVECLPELGGTMPDVPVVDARAAPAAVRCDEGGGFHFEELAEGPWRLRATMADGRAAELVTAPPIGQLLLRLPPGVQAERFRVRTAAGERIAGARVRAIHLGGSSPRREFDGESDATAVTDADGMCTLPLRTSWAVVATVPDGRVGMLHGVAARSPHDSHHAIVVEDAGGLAGSVRGVEPEVLRGARVTAFWGGRELDGSGRGLFATVPVVDGRFAFAALPVGEVALLLHAPGGAALRLDVDGGRWPCSPGAVVRSGQQQQIELSAVPGARVEGAVVDTARRAIAGATVVLEGPVSGHTRGGPERGQHGVRVQDLVGDITFPGQPLVPHPLRQRTVRCDERGRYRFDAVLPGSYRLRVHAAGHALVERQREVRAAGLDEDFVLTPGGNVQGIVDRGSYFHLAAIRDGDDAPSMVVILPFHGAFSLGGLDVGKWHFARSDDRQLVRLGSVEIEAGRTAWIDLRDQDPGVISGRVLDAAGSAISGGVELFHDLQLLAADGSFAFRRATPLLDHQRQVELYVDGLPRHLRLPDDVVGARDWHGEFRLGPNELRLELFDQHGRSSAAEVWFHGPDGGTNLAVPVGGRTLQHLRDGTYHISVTNEHVYVAPQEFELPATRHVVLRAQHAGVVEVTVLDGQGHVKPYFRLIAYPVPRPTDASPRYAHCDADGRARLVLPVGRHHIAPELIGTPPNSVDVRVQSGESTQVTLRVR